METAVPACTGVKLMRPEQRIQSCHAWTSDFHNPELTSECFKFAKLGGSCYTIVENQYRDGGIFSEVFRL